MWASLRESPTSLMPVAPETHLDLHDPRNIPVGLWQGKGHHCEIYLEQDLLSWGKEFTRVLCCLG